MLAERAWRAKSPIFIDLGTDHLWHVAQFEERLTKTLLGGEFLSSFLS
jgi:hypothetical protein